MRPQDSKNISPHLSQMQSVSSITQSVSAITNESSTDFPAHFEKVTVKTTGKGSKLDPEELATVIACLEADLATGRCLDACYTEIDYKIMPILVKQANHEDPGLNLKLALTPQKLPSLIKATIDSGVKSARYLVNIGEERSHFAVIDHQGVNDKISLLMLEPSTSRNENAATLAIRVKQAIDSASLPGCFFAVAEIDLQQKTSENGIVSLSFAKKLHKEARALKRAHITNAHSNDILCKPGTPFIFPGTVDFYIPFAFYKHAGNRERIGAYIQKNPAYSHTIVNKKKETLFGRVSRRLVTREEQTFSLSTYQKRICAYKSALEYSLSQTQESESANEASAGPSTDLEQTSPKPETFEPERNLPSHKPERSIPFTPNELKNTIAGLESDLADGKWVNDNEHYASTDIDLMPALVDQANHKHPGLNLQFFMGPEEFSLSIKETIATGNRVSRSIICLDPIMIHCAVVDQRTIDGETSLILFEPTQSDNMITNILTTRTQQALCEQPLPRCHFSIVELNIQRSNSECGMFSLALAKKLHTKADQVTRMHQDNISGLLCKPDEVVPYEKADHYLPAHFYKHTQGRRRFKEYIKSNPEAAKQTVNKKEENLVKRFNKSLVELEGRTLSVSIHRKRIREYKSLLI